MTIASAKEGYEYNNDDDDSDDDDHKNALTNRRYDVKQCSLLSLQDVQIHTGRELSHGDQLTAFREMTHETDHETVYVEEGQESWEHILEIS